MYSNNDFRYYKEGEYLAHYGVKGMKWHKHLKAATDWWKYDVTGSGYKEDAKKALEGKAYKKGSKISTTHPDSYYGLSARANSLRSQSQHKAETAKNRVDRGEAKRLKTRADGLDMVLKSRKKRADKATWNYYQKSVKGRTEAKASDIKDYVTNKLSKLKEKRSKYGRLRYTKSLGLHIER